MKGILRGTLSKPGALNENELISSHLFSQNAKSWLAAVAETSGDAIVGIGLDGRVTSWNKAAETTFGHTIDEIIGQPIALIIPPDRTQEEILILDRVFKGEKIRTFVTERRAKDGTIIPMSVTVVSILDPKSRIIGVAKLARDLREVRRVASILGRRARLLSSVLEIVPDAMVVFDQLGIIQNFSSGAIRLFGYRTEEVIGHNVSMLMPSQIRDDHNDHLVRHPSTGGPGAIGADRIVFGQRKDGTTFPAELTLGEVNLPEGRLFTGFVRNMTDRDERENKLRLALAEAKRANEAKSRFLAAMSHELRTPLNGILGYARLLHMEGGLNPSQDSRVGAMLVAGEHLLQMIACVLDLSEIDAEHVEVQAVECDVHAVAAACVDLLRPAAEVKELTLSIAVAPGARRVIVTDPTRLRQVMLNLLGNAVKFTARGGIELRLRPMSSGSALRIEITDTGPGIAAQDRQRLFQAVERLDLEAIDAAKGAELGLAISARLAALMGGRIGHDDNPGGGSVFWLELPLNTVAKPLPFSPSASAMPKAGLAPPRSLHVLVVDDIFMNRDIACSFLRAGGHTSMSVEGGAEAVAAVLSTTFDLVLMDVRMPGVDGLEATRRIRMLEGGRGQLPIMALTAQAFTQQIEACHKAGMDSHLAKPFDLVTLLAAVARAAGINAEGGSLSFPKQATSEPAPPLSAAIPPIINSDAFDQAVGYLAPETAATYLETIAKDGMTLLHALRKSGALKRDRDGLADAAHTLGGSAGLFGFERLAAGARLLDRAIRSGEGDLPVLAKALSITLKATRRMIATRRATLAAQRELSPQRFSA